MVRPYLRVAAVCLLQLLLLPLTRSMATDPAAVSRHFARIRIRAGSLDVAVRDRMSSREISHRQQHHT